MQIANMVSHLDDCDWSYPRGREGQDDVIRWKILVSSDRTPTDEMIMGILEVPPGATMGTHSHSPPEVYYIYAGCGDVYINGTVHRVKPGSVVYLNANSIHGVRNPTDTTLCLMWMFAGDSYKDITYRKAETDF